MRFGCYNQAVETITIVLAGGFGVRTNGVLGDTPKLLAKVANGTILDHILKDLNKTGLKLLIATNGLFYDSINGFVNKNYPNKDLKIINNHKKVPEDRLGALGDLLNAIDSEEIMDDKNILVLPSDTAYWESFSIKDFLDFADLHTDSFITVIYDLGDREKIKNNLGCVTLDEKNCVLEFEEKPENPKTTLAIVAMYFFRPEHINLLREFKKTGGNLNSPSNIIPFLMKRGIKISAFLSKGKVIDANNAEQISEIIGY
jgi:glucose-1-phosphate thymidylyltransferase